MPIRPRHGTCGAGGISVGPLYTGPAQDREGADRNSADFSCCSKVLLAEVSHSLIRNRTTHNKVVKLMFGYMSQAPGWCQLSEDDLYLLGPVAAGDGEAVVYRRIWARVGALWMLLRKTELPAFAVPAVVTD